MEILSEVAKKRLTHEIEMTSWENFFGKNYIEVYGIKQGSRPYVTVADYNESLKQISPVPVIITLMLFPSAFFLFGVYLIRKFSPERASIPQHRVEHHI